MVKIALLLLIAIIDLLKSKDTPQASLNVTKEYIVALTVHGPSVPKNYHYKSEIFENIYKLPHDSLTQTGQ